MIILSVSDTLVPHLYSPLIRANFQHVDCVIGCGDLPYYYQEFIVTLLNVPLYFVHGNHDPRVEYSKHSECTAPFF